MADAPEALRPAGRLGIGPRVGIGVAIVEWRLAARVRIATRLNVGGEAGTFSLYPGDTLNLLIDQCRQSQAPLRQWRSAVLCNLKVTRVSLSPGKVATLDAVMLGYVLVCHALPAVLAHCSLPAANDVCHRTLYRETRHHAARQG